jgi:hypothetical protein
MRSPVKIKSVSKIAMFFPWLIKSPYKMFGLMSRLEVEVFVHGSLAFPFYLIFFGQGSL